MCEEEKRAINNMKLFARVHQDMTVVTAEEMDIVLKLVEKLQRENEELRLEEKRRIIGRYGDTEIHKVINKVLADDYVSKQKVKEKIEELKEIADEDNKDEYIKIQVLQELLREE